MRRESSPDEMDDRPAGRRRARRAEVADGNLVVVRRGTDEE
jgi:hypothetical protein